MESLHEQAIRVKQAELYRLLNAGGTFREESYEPYIELLDKDIVTYVCFAEECVSPYKHLFGLDEGEVLSESCLEDVAQCIVEGRCPHIQDELKVFTWRLVHFAAMEDCQPLLKYLCEKQGCDLNIQTSSPESCSPLWFAVQNNRLDIVKYLLSRQVDLNTGLRPPLCTAIEWERKAIFELLIQQKNIDLNWKDVYGKPLLTYCVLNKRLYVEPLLEAGACPDGSATNGVTPLMKAVMNRDQELVKLFLKFGANVNQKSRSGETAILICVYREETEMCRLLLEAGADPNFQTKNDGNSLLLLSSYDGCLEIVQLLMEFGGDAARPNNIGYTPLHIAAWNGHLDCVKAFLAAGVPHDEQTTDKNTPLALAAHGGHVGVIEVLLSLNCNVNNVDKDSDTALHYAAYNGLTRACELLLSHGADPNMANQVNTTPLWNAVYKSKKDVVKLLLLANVKLEVFSRGIDQHAMTDDVVYIYDEPKSALWVSVTNNYPAITLLLISAGYDIHRERWLMEGEISENCESGIYNILTHHAHTPPRLVSRCRNFLRGYFGRNVMEQVKHLPIPETLKSYLTLSDLL